LTSHHYSDVIRKPRLYFLSSGGEILSPILRIVLWVTGALAVGFAIARPLNWIARPEVGFGLATLLGLITLICIALQRRGHQTLAGLLLY